MSEELDGHVAAQGVFDRLVDLAFVLQAADALDKPGLLAVLDQQGSEGFAQQGIDAFVALHHRRSIVQRPPACGELPPQAAQGREKNA